MAAAKNQKNNVTANQGNKPVAKKAKVAPKKTTKKPVAKKPATKAKTKPKKEEKVEKKSMTLGQKIGLVAAGVGALALGIFHKKSKDAAWENGFIEGKNAAQEKSETNNDTAAQQ